MARLAVGEGLGAVTDVFEEHFGVAGFVIGAEHFFWFADKSVDGSEFFMFLNFWHDRVAATVDHHGSLGTEETLAVRAVFVAAADAHVVLHDETILGHRAGSELQDGGNRIGPLAVVLEGVLAAHGRDGYRVFNTHGPKHDVVVMHAPSNLMPAAGKLDPVVAVVVVPVGIVWPIRRGPHVKIPIECLGRVAISGRAEAGRPIIVVPNFDFRNIAQLAIADRLDGFVIVLSAALLRAGLHDAVVLLGGLDGELALANRVAHRLLGINILAGLAGGDDRQHVPVRLRGDDHRVDVFVVHDFSEVAMGSDFLATGFTAKCVEVRGVDVANGDYSCAGIVHEARQKRTGAGPAADKGNINLVIGAGFRIGPQRKTASHRHTGSRASRANNKIPSTGLCAHNNILELFEVKIVFIVGVSCMVVPTPSTTWPTPWPIPPS